MSPRSSYVSAGIKRLPSCWEDEEGRVLQQSSPFTFIPELGLAVLFTLINLVNLAVIDVDIGDIKQTPAWTTGRWLVVGSAATCQVLNIAEGILQ